MDNIIKIKDINELNDLKDVTEGQVAFKEETGEYFLYQKGYWFPVEGHMTSEGLQLNLYELNRNIVSQLPDYGDDQWEGARKVIEDWLKEKTCVHYMLYGREINYFTIFKKDNEPEFDSLFDGLKECLVALGPVKSIAVNELEDGSASSIEIWLTYEDVTTCMYLFDYDDGIVTFK